MRSRRLVCVLLALAVTGCFERSPGPVTPCAQSQLAEMLRVEVPNDTIDLLLMIDDSSSMAEERRSILDEIPRIVGVLTTGDRDGDGVRDFTPTRSLHLGIISSDMGVGAVSGIPSCSAGFGDDGIIVNRAGGDCGAACGAPIFEFRRGRASSPSFCPTSLGTDGCGYEQQLEASLKAVSLAPTGDGRSPVAWTRAGYRPPIFRDGTLGHGGVGGCNDAFLRPTSSLAILLVTDEDDCSVIDPSIFDPDDPRFSDVDPNLRCHTFADALEPVERYVDGFIGLRPASSLLVFEAIAGVPRSAVDGGLSYDDMLALPEMTERIDPVLGDRLSPACTAPAGRGVAYPARRIVQVAQGLERLGAATSVHSICDTSFTAAVDVMIERLAAQLSGACLPRGLNPDAAGNVDCEVHELLPAIGGDLENQRCAELAFERLDVETTIVEGVEVRRELCGVPQVGRAGASMQAGWFYDDGDPRLGYASLLAEGCDQRVAFSVTQAIPGAEIRVACAATILPATGAAAQRGSFCDPETGAVAGTGARCEDGIATPGILTSLLTCDPFDRTCEIRCVADSDCTAAGLRGFVCDQRTADEVFASARPEELAADLVHAFCVNPSCRAD